MREEMFMIGRLYRIAVRTAFDMAELSCSRQGNA